MIQTTEIPGFSDPVSSLSHLLGAAVFLALSIPLVRRGVGCRARGLSLLVFCAAAVVLLSMSGVFHLLSQGTARDVLQRLDHAAIFLFIAATFTPVQFILFRGFWRWGMLVFVWTIAVLGITLKSVFFTNTPEALGVGLYLGMGWVGLISGALLVRHQGWRFIGTLIAGGVVYTLGALCDLLRFPVLIPGVLGPHEIFHFAVLGGLGLHWAFVWSLADGTRPVAGRVARPREDDQRAAA